MCYKLEYGNVTSPTLRREIIIHVYCRWWSRHRSIDIDREADVLDLWSVSGLIRDPDHLEFLSPLMTFVIYHSIALTAPSPRYYKTSSSIRPYRFLSIPKKDKSGSKLALLIGVLETLVMINRLLLFII